MAVSVDTHLMFQNGRALEALRRHEEILAMAFTIDELDTYDETAAGLTGQVQLAVCTLLGQRITCIDSPVQHDFDMTPAISLFVECDDEEELERLFVTLAENGEVFMPLDDYGFSRRYGWVPDRFGVPGNSGPSAVPEQSAGRAARTIPDRRLDVAVAPVRAFERLLR
jgi:predicted 3-demethylubiquinone-9 3-methyltransferase (glyoxalase superfamily)